MYFSSCRSPGVSPRGTSTGCTAPPTKSAPDLLPARGPARKSDSPRRRQDFPFDLSVEIAPDVFAQRVVLLLVSEAPCHTAAFDRGNIDGIAQLPEEFRGLHADPERLHLAVPVVEKGRFLRGPGRCRCISSSPASIILFRYSIGSKQRARIFSERAHPRRDRRAGHAARRGGERRLFGADRAVRVRGFRIPHPRAFRQRGNRVP